MDFNLPDLNGHIFLPGQARGRILVLNFWSAECPWSQRADVELSAWLPAWGERVVYWAVASNADEDDDLLRRVGLERGLTLLLDRQHSLADQLEAVTTPHFFIVDADGRLRYQGAFDDTTFRQRTPTRNFVFEAVAALLAGREPDPTEVRPYGCTIVRYARDA